MHCAETHALKLIKPMLSYLNTDFISFTFNFATNSFALRVSRRRLPLWVAEAIAVLDGVDEAINHRPPIVRIVV